MPRPSKKSAQEDKQPVLVAPAAPVVPAAPQAPARVIDVDNFIRVRDSVFARLTTIQDLIKSFSVDYLRQTNLLLGEPTNIENDPILAQMGGINRHLNALDSQFAAINPPEEKKERKKRTHDPNAPKRPLTPYFLYMQTARPIIAKDLGENAPKGAVQEEGQRRWASMNVAEKQGWNQAYQYNLRLYNARVHSYKHGNLEARNMDDDQAMTYAEEHNITMPAVNGLEEIGNDQDAIALQLGQTAAAENASHEEDEEDDDEEEKVEEKPAPPAKTPKKGSTRKRKTATPAVDETPAGTESKKRKRTSTKPAAEPEVEPKKSSRKKANKS